jgi:glutamate 5-kinase
MKRICIKIGSNVLTKNNGELDIERIENIVYQISELRKQGYECLLVSSGAVAIGRSKIKLSDKTDTVSARQVWSSVGQVELLNIYSKFLSKYDIQCAQVLVAKQDFSTREHYLNMKNCLNSLLSNNILPIINENDTVSVTALMFTDNDELSGLIASMMNVDGLYILSNINGIYNGDPNKASSTLIQTINGDISTLKKFITTKKSNFGRGGMLTKCNIAGRISKSGIPVYIANGTKNNMLINLINRSTEIEHTKFIPSKKTSNVKQWLAGSDGFEKARITINQGAEEALLSQKASSLLPIGIVDMQGDFEKGDIVKIINSRGKTIGLGKAQYGKLKGESYMGKVGVKPLVHYDYLFLY